MKKCFYILVVVVLYLTDSIAFLYAEENVNFYNRHPKSSSFGSNNDESIADHSIHVKSSIFSNPVHRAFNFLHINQIKTSFRETIKGVRFIDYAGNWPQFFYPNDEPNKRIREVSPFIVTFIHHALTHITKENMEILGLTEDFIKRARVMRKRAIDFMKRFKARTTDPDAGTFAFWPYSDDIDEEENPSEQLALRIAKGPIFNGSREPINFDNFPDELAIPSDADDTATIYVALLDNILLDNGSEVNIKIDQFFADWRDTGEIPLRINPEWLPPASEAFLTWLIYKNPPDNQIPNDVDIVVNTNVLYCLARYNLLDTPGADEAIALINSITEQGLHRIPDAKISDYYPDNFAFYYLVSRAFHEGPVSDLESSINILANDLEQSVIFRDDGTAFWNKGNPHLNTAFAVITLLNAGGDKSIIDSSINYLVNEQNRLFGNWNEGIFFIGNTDGGQQINWVSTSFTTAIVLEALCRYQIDFGEGLPNDEK